MTFQKRCTNQSINLNSTEVERRKSTAYVWCIESMKIKDAIKQMKEGKELYAKHTPELLEVFPETLEGMNLEIFDELIPIQKGLVRKTIFMGYPHHGHDLKGTGMHAAIIQNLMAMMQGSKDWTIIHPRYTPYLRPFIVQGIPAVNSESNFESLEEKERLLKRLPRYKHTLHPGDALINPSWWWHEIGNSEGFNFAIALRPGGPGALRNLIPSYGVGYSMSVTTLPAITKAFYSSIAAKFSERYSWKNYNWIDEGQDDEDHLSKINEINEAANKENFL